MKYRIVCMIGSCQRNLKENVPEQEVFQIKRVIATIFEFMNEIDNYTMLLATVYKGNIIKNLIMDCQSYTKYRPNETTGGIFVSWRRKEELPTGA